MKKTLSVILSVLMIVASVPIFASAAAISLLRTNVEIVPPTASVTEITYGSTLEGITFLGGECWYIDPDTGTKTLVEGEFKAYNAATKPSVSEAYAPNLKFYPTDTSAFTESNLLPATRTTIKSGTWPTIRVKGIETKLTGTPYAICEAGKVLAFATLFDNTVVDADGNEVTAGRWRFTDDGTIVPENGKEYEITWTCTGYEPITINIPVQVDGEPVKTGVVTSWPTIECPEWSVGLTVGDLALTGGEATVEGTFAIKTDASTYVQPNKSNIVQVEFTPVEADVEMVGGTIGAVNFTPAYTLKDFEVTKAPDTYSYEFGAKYIRQISGNAANYGVETDLPEDMTTLISVASAVDENGNTVDVMDRYLAPGKYTVTVLIQPDVVNVTGVGRMQLYNRQYTELTVIITKKLETQKFGYGNIVNPDDDNSASVYYTFSSQEGANGYCVLKANGEVILDNIPHTADYIDFYAKKSGTYTFTLEYIPAEDDYIEYESTVINIGEVTLTVSKPPVVDEDGNSVPCEHLCHSENTLIQMLWKLINFFCQLFDIQQYCDCGNTHYDAPFFG